MKCISFYGTEWERTGTTGTQGWDGLGWAGMGWAGSHYARGYRGGTSPIVNLYSASIALRQLGVLYSVSSCELACDEAGDGVGVWIF